MLPRVLVYAIARLGLRGLDLETVLLGGGRKEAPDRMFLPIRSSHNLGQARPFGPPDQFQDLCALALGAWRTGFLGRGGFALLAGLGFLLRRGFGFPALGAFLPLGAPFFWVAPFFEEAFSGATCAPCSATAAAFSLIVASTFVMVVNPFCA
jgi:hypothetical protein